MLTLGTVRRELASLPTLSRAGLAAMAFALFVDVIAHVEASGHAGHLHEHTPTEVWAHVGVLVGMVLIFLGVAVDGARKQRVRRRSGEHNTEGVA